MYYYLFMLATLPENAPEWALEQRRLLNDVINKVNEWTRANKPEDHRASILIAEIDLVRRTLGRNECLQDWYNDCLKQLEDYVNNDKIPFNEAVNGE